MPIYCTEQVDEFKNSIEIKMRKTFRSNRPLEISRKMSCFFFMSIRFVNTISSDRSYQFLGESSKSRSARDLSVGGNDHH